MSALSANYRRDARGRVVARVSDEVATIDYDAVDWGYALCRWCRLGVADALLDDELICVACADLLLERWSALELAPSLRDTLPDMFG